VRKISHFVPRTPLPNDPTHTTFVTVDENGHHYAQAGGAEIPRRRLSTLVAAGVLQPVDRRLRIEVDGTARVVIHSDGAVMVNTDSSGSMIGKVDRPPCGRKVRLTHATNRRNPADAFEVRVADVNHVTWFQDGHTEVGYRSPAAGHGFEVVACVMETAAQVIAALEERDNT
jgi:hypothetical protein